MNNGKKTPTLGESLIEGLEDGIRWMKGEIDVETFNVEVPGSPLALKKTVTRKVARVGSQSISSSQSHSSMTESAPVIRAKNKA